MFKNAIVRRPCRAMVDGVTSAPELGKPDYELALVQHDAYIDALKKCGVRVKVLEACERFPDSCFIEDVAVITKNGAIVTNPGAMSRNREAEMIIPIIKEFFPEEKISYIVDPGTLDGGDVMMVGEHFYIGRSARTNKEGVRQFIKILERFGFSGSEVTLENVLHLKTGINYVENNNMLVSGEFLEKEEFKIFNHIIIPEDEGYAANCIWINGKVIIPKGYSKVERALRDAGYEVVIVDTSEYKKLDGGLSCLSLRF